MVAYELEVYTNSLWIWEIVLNIGNLRHYAALQEPCVTEIPEALQIHTGISHIKLNKDPSYISLYFLWFWGLRSFQEGYSTHHFI